VKGGKLPLRAAGIRALPGKSWQKGSGNNLWQVLLPHVPARPPDRGQDVFRGYKALVELHVEKPGLLVKLRPGDPRDFFDLVAHGVGAARSEKAALFLHTGDFKSKIGQKILLHYSP
jgi:hypothetical protein